MSKTPVLANSVHLGISGRISILVHPAEAYVVGNTRQKHERNLLLGLDKRGRPYHLRYRSWCREVPLPLLRLPDARQIVEKRCVLSETHQQRRGTGTSAAWWGMQIPDEPSFMRLEIVIITRVTKTYASVG